MGRGGAGWTTGSGADGLQGRKSVCRFHDREMLFPEHLRHGSRNWSSSSTIRTATSRGRDGVGSAETRRGGRSGRANRGKREQHANRGSLAGFALNGDGAFEGADDSLDDGESEAASGGLRSEEGIEKPGPGIGGDATAGIGDLQLQVIAFGRGRPPAPESSAVLP